jgi:predicted PurR-regulated permease PerM
MIVERMLMVLLLGAVGVGCWLVLYPFLSAVLWAGILVYTTWPGFIWLRASMRGRARLAAGAMVLLTAAVVLLPVVVAAPASAEDVSALRGVFMEWVRQGLPPAPDWLADLPMIGPKAAELWNHWAADIGAILGAIRPYLGVVVEDSLAILLSIANGVLMFAFALFIAFFLFVHGDPLAVRLRVLVCRVAGDQAERLLEVTGATVRGVVYGVLGTAIVQGLLTSLGLWVTGVPRALLLGFIAGLMSVLPVGAPAIWIPAAIWLMATGSLWWGVFLFVYGIVAISGSDSVIRPWFIARGAHLPFMLTALGALGGALAYGLLGIFLGPVLLGVGYTLVAEWTRPEAATR